MPLNWAKPRGIKPQATAEAKCFIRENCPIKVYEVAAMLDVSSGPAHHIIHDVLQSHKVSIRRVP
jgi:hypothetical protein